MGFLCSDPTRVQRACRRPGYASSRKEVDDYLFSYGRLPATQRFEDVEPMAMFDYLQDNGSA